MATGVARVVDDPTQIDVLRGLGIRSWLSAPTPHYVAIAIEQISGRRLAAADATAQIDRG